MIPSLKAAQAELRRRLQAADDWHDRALHTLQPGHSWADVDNLECTRCDMALEAHKAFKAAEAEWNAYLAAEIASGNA